MFLMYKDIIVLEIDKGNWKIHNQNYMPYGLRDFIGTNFPNTLDMFLLSPKERYYDRFIGFCSRRVLTLARKYAKKIFNAFNLDQYDDVHSLAKLAMECSLLSVEDKYWMCEDPSKIKWKDVDLENHHLNEVILTVALKGDSITITGDLERQELCTGGTFPKAWIRKEDGLYLLKHILDGYTDGPENDICVSNILDKFSVNHVKYTWYKWKTLDCSCCKNMRTQSYSRVPAKEVGMWAITQHRKLVDIAKEIDPDGYYKMLITDYLISNTDRHTSNWGFYMDDSTGKLISLHPLFDHNMAFDHAALLNDDFKSKVEPDKTMKELAEDAMSKCDYKFIGDELSASDFPCTIAYKCFTDKAKHLGIL